MREDPLPGVDPNEKFMEWGVSWLLGQTEKHVEYDRAGRIINDLAHSICIDLFLWINHFIHFTTFSFYIILLFILYHFRALTFCKHVVMNNDFIFLVLFSNHFVWPKEKGRRKMNGKICCCTLNHIYIRMKNKDNVKGKNHPLCKPKEQKYTVSCFGKTHFNRVP